MARRRGIILLLIQLSVAGCGMAQTPVTTPPVQTGWPRPSLPPGGSPAFARPSVTPWPTRPTRRPTGVYTHPPGPTCPQVSPPGTESDPLVFTPTGMLKEEQAFGRYVIRVYEDWDCVVESLEVLKDGQRVYAQNGQLHFWIGGVLRDDEGGEHVIPMGRDITGDGVPNLVVRQWTGGMQCCLILYVFDLGEEFRRASILELHQDESTYFSDLDGDANLELVTAEWTFSWDQGFRDFSLVQNVILRFDGGAYHLAADLMRKPTPAAADLLARARSIRDKAWGNCDPFPPGLGIRLSASLLDLVYSGNAELLGGFLDLAWPANCPGKDGFLNGFLKWLPLSPYWPELKDLSDEWPWPEP